MADETTTINAEIPRDLHDEVRMRSVLERRPVKAIVRDALVDYVERAKAADGKPKPKKVPA